MPSLGEIILIFWYYFLLFFGYLTMFVLFVGNSRDFDGEN